MSIHGVVLWGVVMLAGTTLQLAGKISEAMERQSVTSETENGFITLESGLRYRVLEAGTGDRAGIEDIVVVEYRGTLQDGTEFDSTHRRGKPATFPVRQVIPGWREALQLMQVGSKWQLIVPPQLAYGKHGVAGLIGPDATLVFEVELLTIVAATADSDQLKDIEVSFKLDPRLTRSLYMGDRWVAPPTFSSVRSEGDTYTLEARVQGIAATGGSIHVNPEWIPSDPDMVKVSTIGDNTFRILVTQAGESRLLLETPGFSKELRITATREGNTMQVQISQ